MAPSPPTPKWGWPEVVPSISNNNSGSRWSSVLNVAIGRDNRMNCAQFAAKRSGCAPHSMNAVHSRTATSIRVGASVV